MSRFVTPASILIGGGKRIWYLSIVWAGDVTSRKCLRRVQRCAGGWCHGQRRQARELEIVAVQAIQVPAGTEQDAEKEREGGQHADSKGGFSDSEKEVAADYE